MPVQLPLTVPVSPCQTRPVDQRRTMPVQLLLPSLLAVPVSPGARPTPWLTAAEAADYLRLPTVRALYKRVERGQVPAHRLGRQFRFHRRDLDALLGSGPVSAAAEEGSR